MPMDFPDMPSLVRAAKCHQFRPPNPDETEAHYRNALADHVAAISGIESYEIRTGKGWDKWTQEERVNFLQSTFPIVIGAFGPSTNDE